MSFRTVATSLKAGRTTKGREMNIQMENQEVCDTRNDSVFRSIQFFIYSFTVYSESY